MMSAAQEEPPSSPFDPESWGRRLLERELYWAAEPAVVETSSAGELKEAWSEAADRLYLQSREPVPQDPVLTTGGGWRRRLKFLLFRIFRPISRRYDRMGAEIASLGASTAGRLEAVEGTTESLRWTVGALRADVSLLANAQAPRLGEPAEVPETFYWHFEGYMRGQDTVVERLGQYEEPARRLLEEHGAEPSPLWLDLGCGRGEFGLLLQKWGWRVHGVDISGDAVDESIAAGIDAVQGDAVAYITNYPGEAPVGVSAIQLIEHLPREQWLRFIRGAHAVLKPGGALLVETINPLNVRALAGAFFADLTHTWPAHPHTLRLMAESVGFQKAEILWLNPDEDRNAQDFAIWAVKG